MVGPAGEVQFAWKDDSEPQWLACIQDVRRCLERMMPLVISEALRREQQDHLNDDEMMKLNKCQVRASKSVTESRNDLE
ncbi:hypothetical protein Hypma_009700 [Hypsizygus marmoreus]|uniref:Uncharacterized protein n=1 Tax=Hypsizygus marmoreus TaxID=39966 RepID=A0A369JPC0_HYPMA|nr:hypothetical protein Hypma_009700 [Hypsizygus marmoreus]